MSVVAGSSDASAAWRNLLAAVPAQLAALLMTCDCVGPHRQSVRVIQVGPPPRVRGLGVTGRTLDRRTLVRFGSTPCPTAVVGREHRVGLTAGAAGGFSIS